MTRWNVEGPESDDYVVEPPTPLTSLVYLRGALRRRWRTWAATAAVGLALALLYTWHAPPPSLATVQLLLQHPSGSDATAAMQTDVAMLQTREVADRTVKALGSDATATDFLATYSGTATTPSVLTIRVNAPSDGEAVRTARTLASTYLAYRSTQLQASVTAQIAGVQNQIATLRQQQTAARDQYNQFAGTPSGSSIASSALQREASLQAQIGSLNESVQSAQSAAQALIDGSTVLDPAGIVPGAPLKHLLTTLITGLVGGTAIGAGLVVLVALTSTRLRRREDIAAVTGAPVTHSVRGVGTSTWSRLPLAHRRHRSSASDGVQVLAQGLEVVAESAGGTHVALVTLDDEEAALKVASFAGARLNSAEHRVVLTDLTASGRLERHVRDHIGVALRPTVSPTVLRPAGLPALARGPLGAERGGRTDHTHTQDRSRWDAANVTIAVAPADLDTGLDNLATWADVAVLLVTAGRSSGEQLSTAAGLLRSAGLEIRSVLLIGADPTDESFGRDLAPEDAAGRDAASREGVNGEARSDHPEARLLR